MRKSASTGSTVLASLPKDSYITLISLSGNWYYVEYTDGKFGYCHSDYIKLDSAKTATAKTQSTSLNVRSGGGINYAIQDTIPKGEIVIILSTTNGWSKILYNGTKTGFVSSNYLSTSTVSTNYSKITSKERCMYSCWNNDT